MAGEEQIEQRKDYYDDGALEAERTVRVLPDQTEVNHGPYVRWHANGIKAEEGVFENGEKVGLWRSWTPDGRNFFDGRYLPGEAGGDNAADDKQSASRSADAEPAEPADAATREETKELEASVSKGGRKALWFETIAVLSLIWAAPLAMGLSSWMVYDGAHYVPSFAYDAVSHLALTVPTFLVLLYLVFRSGEGFKAFGIVRPRVIDLPIGIALCAVVYAAEILVFVRYGWLRSSYMPPMPLGIGEIVLLVVMYLVNSLAEEFGMRGYLIRRFSQLLKSPWIAYLLSSVMFASYHLYQGWVGGLGALVFGLGYGAVYILTRRIWPLVIAHTIHNLLLYNEFFAQWFDTPPAA